jgi:hypothetical protein
MYYSSIFLLGIESKIKYEYAMRFEILQRIKLNEKKMIMF